jgi:hypothetical protein
MTPYDHHFDDQQCEICYSLNIDLKGVSNQRRKKAAENEVLDRRGVHVAFRNAHGWKPALCPLLTSAVKACPEKAN